MEGSKSYMTVSPSGLSEYGSDGAPIHFMPLDEWLNERFMYRAVRELRFFKDFGKRKMFQLWKDAGAKGRMSKAASRLEDRGVPCRYMAALRSSLWFPMLSQAFLLSP